MMELYDPDIAPDPGEWMALDEDARILLVERHHRDARVSLPRSARRPHAAFHVIVENQLAMNDPPLVRATLQRLMQEGLSRHDAVHAISSVFITELYERLQEEDVPETPVLNEAYAAALQALTAQTWRES